MSVNRPALYQKIGATFADAAAAKANKDSLFPPALSQSVNDCYATMLANGVLLEPVSYTWDQSSYTLTVVKVVSSSEAYNAAITFDSAATINYASQAGWTILNPA